MGAALIFDFDGLILDTETPEMLLWEQRFAAAGGAFDRKAYQSIIGSWESDGYDPGLELAKLLKNGASPDKLLWEVRNEAVGFINQQPPLPGVDRVIDTARKLGYRLGVGSSSPRDWVVGHLKRLNLFGFFDAVVTFDDVSQSKPSPEIFLKVLHLLDVGAAQALVLEDSHNGILAARRAGIRAVAVPNPVTDGQDFSGAEEVLSSLLQLDLTSYFPNHKG